MDSENTNIEHTLNPSQHPAAMMAAWCQVTGVPLDDERMQEPEKHWDNFSSFQKGWEAAAGAHAQFVRLVARLDALGDTNESEESQPTADDDGLALGNLIQMARNLVGAPETKIETEPGQSFTNLGIADLRAVRFQTFRHIDGRVTLRGELAMFASLNIDQAYADYATSDAGREDMRQRLKIRIWQMLYKDINDRLHTLIRYMQRELQRYGEPSEALEVAKALRDRIRPDNMGV